MVRLKLAVPDAEAYERAMALVADGRLTALDGEAYLVVGEFADARQAYSFGRALQRRLQLPFELVYDPGHPQADLAWARPFAIAAAPAAASPAKPKTPEPIEPLPPIALLYLYATPANERQQQLLAQGLPLVPMGGSPSRVQTGVFRDTPSGRRLLAAQRQRLQALAVPYEQVRLEPSRPVIATSIQQPESISMLPEPDL
ncbi:MAG: hypothetical protein ACNA8O_01220 [Cyanobacteriota bacterium]